MCHVRVLTEDAPKNRPGYPVHADRCLMSDLCTVTPASR